MGLTGAPMATGARVAFLGGFLQPEIDRDLAQLVGVVDVVAPLVLGREDSPVEAVAFAVV